MTNRFEVQRDIPATPAAVFALLCDPQGHVAIDASGQLQSAEGETVCAVGDRFLVHMDRQVVPGDTWGRYDVIVTITQFEQDALLEWGVRRPPGDMRGHRYGYRLEPSELGCLVTSYYDWSNISDFPVERRHIFPVIPEEGLRSTLGILARTVTKPSN